MSIRQKFTSARLLLILFYFEILRISLENLMNSMDRELFPVTNLW